MSMFDDIRRCAAAGMSYGYCVVLFGGGAAYIDGITRVMEIGGERVVFASEKRIITLSGEDLTVTRLGDGDAIVRGKIYAFGEET